MRTVREFSAGGVIYRRRKDQVEVALIHTGKRWGLPKGHVEEGERVEETVEPTPGSKPATSGTAPSKTDKVDE